MAARKLRNTVRGRQTGRRPGLALTRHTDYIRYGRVRIVGQSEIGYLRKLAARERLLKERGFDAARELTTRHSAPRGRS